MTKVGASWENCTYTFTAKIMNKCLGVVIRAQGLSDYYMLQINTDKVVLHRRISVPFFASGQAKGNHPIQYEFKVGWQVFPTSIPIEPPLHGWFDVKILVRGEAFHLYLNGQLHYQMDSFLKIATGKGGFRNHSDESAYVKDVRVLVEQ